MPSEETCANCDRSIGKLEEGFAWKDNVVCNECHQKLSGPKKSKHKYVVLAVVILVAVLGAYWLYLNHNRFYIVVSSKGLAYEVDRRTGKTWVLRGSAKELQTSSDEEGLRQLPSTELLQLTGSASLPGTGSFYGSLYNG